MAPATPGSKHVSFLSTNNREEEAATVRAHQTTTTQHHPPPAAGAAAPGQNSGLSCPCRQNTGGAVKKGQAASADQDSRAQARKGLQVMGMNLRFSYVDLGVISGDPVVDVIMTSMDDPG
eukprot:1140820-Pelagomonas_calceolata.AAC.1